MTKEEIRIECLSEILSDMGLQATPEQVEKIVNDFSFHIEMEREMDSYQHFGHKEECQKCKKLKAELSEVKKERDVYHDSVKRRRSASSVWVQDGEVRYEK